MFYIDPFLELALTMLLMNDKKTNAHTMLMIEKHTRPHKQKKRQWKHSGNSAPTPTLPWFNLEWNDGKYFGQFMAIGKTLKIVTVATMLMMLMAMMTVKKVKMMMMWMMLIMMMMTLHHTDPCCSSCSSLPTSKLRTGCCYNTWTRCSERVVRASSKQMYRHPYLIFVTDPTDIPV